MPVPWDDPYQIAKHNASSPLLKLPAELRIEIYKLCLVQSDRINVNVPFTTFRHRIYRHSPHLKVQPPELFRVSRQIRQETIPIYFRYNEFRVFALNYDVVPYARFLRYHLTYGKPEGLTLRYVGSPDWGNLVKWLELAYLGRCAPPEKREGFWADGRSVLIQGMFEVVERSKGDEWEDVLRALELWRGGLGYRDPRWEV